MSTALEQYRQYLASREPRNTQPAPVVTQPTQANVVTRSYETIIDALSQILVGGRGSLEGITDSFLSKYGLAGGIYDPELRRTVEEEINKNYTQMLDDSLKPYYDDSWRYEMGEGGQRLFTGVGQGVGQMLPALAVSYATGGLGASPALAAALANATFFLGAEGRGIQDALSEGATLEKAQLYGLASGSVELLTERLVGGATKNIFGKGFLDGVISKHVGSKLWRVGVEMIGEGFEEALAEIVNPYLKRMTYDKDAEAWTDEHKAAIIESAIVGGLTSLVFGQTFGRIRSSQQRTAMEINDVKELTKKSEKFYAKGDVDTKVDVELFRAKETLSKRLVKMDDTSRAEFIKQNKLDDQFNADGTVIVANEGINKEAMTPQAYNAKLPEVKIVKEVTAKQKETLRLGAKMSQKVVIADIDPIKVNGKETNINGYYDVETKTIVINSKAKNAQEVYVHELTHKLEGTKEYQKYGNFVLAQAKNNKTLQLVLSDMNVTLKDVAAMYHDPNLSEKKNDYIIVTEFIARATSEVLFTDKVSIAKLAGEQRSNALKILNWLLRKDKELSALKVMTPSEKAYLSVVTRAEGLYQDALEKNVGGLKTSEITDDKDKKASKEMKRFFMDDKRFSLIGLQGLSEATKNSIDLFSFQYNDIAYQIERAKRLEDQGATRQEIKTQTGWLRSKDGNWKFEIDNQDFTLNQKAVNNLLKKYNAHAIQGQRVTLPVRLDSIVEDNRLFEMYPSLRKINLTFKYMGVGTSGGYNVTSNEILFNPDAIPVDSVELKEAIDRRENNIYILDNIIKYKKIGNQYDHLIKMLDNDIRTIVELLERDGVAKLKNISISTSNIDLDIPHVYNNLEKFVKSLKGEQKQIKKDLKELVNGRHIDKTKASQIKSTLLHEIQHAIQGIENWTMGSNPGIAIAAFTNELLQVIDNSPRIVGISSIEVSKRLKEKFFNHNPNMIKQNYYRRQLGEIEARRASQRSILTEEQIKKDNDISYEDDAIVFEYSPLKLTRIYGFLMSNPSVLYSPLSLTVDSSKQSLNEYKDTSNSGQPSIINEFASALLDDALGIKSSPSKSNILQKEQNVNEKRYSITKDSLGNTLSKEQQLFFKDSQVVDAKGNLRVVYHGTGKNFTAFDKNKIGWNHFQSSGGFFFTSRKQTASNFAKMHRENGVENVFESYLNITNPISYDLGKYGESIDYYDDNYNQLMEQAMENNHDGIIISDDRQTLYVALEPNQIKNITNKKPTPSNDMRYSIEIGGEEIRVEKENINDLVALHNISADKLIESIKLGGFPMPSIAITKPDRTHNSFGAVTVVFGRETIDPSFTKNKVWSGDRWTPTFPKVEYDTDSSVFNEVYFYMLDNKDKFKDNPVHFESSNIHQKLEDLGKERFIQKMIENNNLKTYYQSTNQTMDFESWIKDMTERTIKKTGIYNGKDIYTTQGNRRSFDATHYEITLDNIVKVMVSQNGKRFGGGVGVVNASAVKNYQSINEIKKNAHKIVDDETYEKDREVYAEQLSALTSEIAENLKYKDRNKFFDYDNAETYIEYIGEAGGSKQHAKKVFDEFSVTYNDDLLTRVETFFKGLKNKLVRYFEAKPERAVKLSEIKMTLIPNNSSNILIKALETNKIPYQKYNTETESRSDIIKNMKNIRFSLDSNGDELSKEQQEYFKDSKARDKDGKLQVLYHGTVSGDFNIFDIDKTSPENNLGKGFYFTTDSVDVMRNYADGGADYNNKVAKLAEKIQMEHEDTNNDIGYDEAKVLAHQQLYKGMRVVEAYLNITNPYYVNQPLLERSSFYDESDFDSEEEYNDEVDQAISYEVDDIIGAIESEYDFHPHTIGHIRDVLYNAYYEEYNNEQLKEALFDEYIEDNEGNYIANDIHRIVIQSLGYDGIIDETVPSKFKGMKLDPNEKHMVVFNPNQIKYKDNKKPTSNDDIRYSLDSKGRKLSQEQQEYFKDSKIRDLDGKLKVIYHGTGQWSKHLFTYDIKGNMLGVVEVDKPQINFDAFNRRGMKRVYAFFSDRKSTAESYSYPTKEALLEGYGNVKNPFTINASANQWSHIYFDSIELERSDDVHYNKIIKKLQNRYNRPVKYFSTDDLHDVIENYKVDGKYYYDGAIIDNIKDDAGTDRNTVPTTVILVLGEANFKTYDNLNPTKDNRWRYSLDSDGKKLSKEQQTFFKDSKIADADGDLQVVYHGSEEEFTIFNKDLLGTNTEANDAYLGFHFTDNKKLADSFGTQIYKTYLNIKKPFDLSGYPSDQETIQTLDEFMKLAHPEYYQEEYDNDIMNLLDNIFVNREMEYLKGDLAIDKHDFKNFIMKRGFDGMIFNMMDTDVATLKLMKEAPLGNEYIIFNSNQAKRVDNLNPTSNEDIRYSMSDETVAKNVGSKVNLKVYSKKDAEETITKILSNNMMFGDRYYGFVDAKTKEQAIRTLWQALNTAKEGEQAGPAIDIANYIIDAMMLEDVMDENEINQADVEFIQIANNYKGQINLDGVKEEVKYHFGKNQNAFMVWGKRKGNKGQTMDTIAIELERFGIFLSGNSEQELFIEFYNRYKKAQSNIKSVETSILKARRELNQEEIIDLKNHIVREVLLAWNNTGKQTNIAKEIEKYQGIVKNLKAQLKQTRQYTFAVSRLLSTINRVSALEKYQSVESIPLSKEIVGMIKMLTKVKTWRGNLSNSKSIREIFKKYSSMVINADGKQMPLYEYYHQMNNAGTFGGESIYKDIIVIIAEGKGDLTTEEINMVDMILTNFAHNVRNFDKVFFQNREQSEKELTLRAIDETKQTIPLKQSGVSNAIGNYTRWVSSPYARFERLSNYHSDGFFSQVYWELHDGVSKQAGFSRNVAQHFEAFFKKHRKEADSWRNQDVVIGDMTMSRGQMISLYLLGLREQAKTHLYNQPDKSGIVRITNENLAKKHRTSDSVTQGLDGKIDEATMKQIEAMFTPVEKEFIGLTQTFFNQIAKDAKVETDIALFGVTNIVDGNYFPIRVAEDQLYTELGNSEMDFGNLFSVYNASFNKSVKPNANNKIVIENVMDVIERHTQQMGAYYGLAIPIKTFNRVWNKKLDGGSKLNIEVNKVDPNFKKFITKLLKDIQGVKKDKESFDRFMGKITGFWARGALGANPKVWATQFASLFAAGGTGIHYKHLMMGLMKGLANKTDYDMLYKYSAFAYDRARNGNNFDVGQLKQELGVLGKLDTLTNLTTAPIGLLDNLIVGSIWNAALKETESKYKPNSEEHYKAAAKMTEQAVIRTQANWSPLYRPAILRTNNAVLKTLTMFTSEPLQIFTQIAVSLDRVKVARKELAIAEASHSPKDVKIAKEQLKVAKDKYRHYATAITVNAIFLAMVGTTFQWIKFGDEDDETFWTRMFEELTGHFVGMFPIFRDFFSLAQGYELSNMYETGMTNIYKGYTSISNMIEKGILGKEAYNTKDFLKDGRNLLLGISQTLGVPIRNIETYTKGILEKFNQDMIYKYESNFFNQSYASDIQKALEEGNESLAETILERMMNDKNVSMKETGVSAELFRLYKEGYTSMPKAISRTVVIDDESVKLTKAQYNQFQDIYSQADGIVSKMITNLSYRKLDSEAQAKAIKLVYDYYHNLAKEAITGKSYTGNFGLMANAVSVEKLAIASAYASVTEADIRGGKIVQGSRKAKIERMMMGLGLSTTYKNMVMGYLGYSNSQGESQVRMYINRLNLTKEQKALLLSLSGY